MKNMMPSISHSCVLTISFLTVLLQTSEAEFCHHDKVKGCLQETLDFLKSHAGNGESFLLASVEHYVDLLKATGDHEDLIHISALDTVIKPLDALLFEGSLLDDLCPKTKEATACLHKVDEYCDGDIRYELDGLIDVFDNICKKPTRDVFKRDACVRGSEVVNMTMQCERQMNRSIDKLHLPHECLNSDNITVACSDEVSEAGERLLRSGYVIKIDSNGAHEVYRERICKTVNNALQCHRSDVQHVCGKQAAEWEYNLRHSLIHFLMLDLGCQSENGVSCNETFFLCSDDACINSSLVCDGVEHCSDGADESAKHCGNEGINALTVGLIVLVVIIVVAIGIGCGVKCWQERQFTDGLKTQSGSEEMMDIVAQEMAIGQSTPPPNHYKSNDNNFVYKPVRT